MNTTATVAAGVCGLLAGPAAAALTVTLPARQPLDRLWWFGRPASLKRIAAIAIGSGLVAAACGAGMGAVAALPGFVVFGIASMVLSVVDAAHFRLPFVVSVPATCFGAANLVIAAAIEGYGRQLVAALMSGVVVGAVFLLLGLTIPSGMGGGDIVIATAIGMLLGWLGPHALVVGLAAGLGIAVLIAVVRVWRTRTLNSPVPIGPALLAGWFIGVVVGS